MTTRKLPMSIEDLIPKDSQEEKPKFLSKEERAKLALEKRTLKVQQQQHSFFSSANKKATPEPPIQQEEMKQIKNNYLRVEREPKKVRRSRDKKFVFDWDEKEDTSTDINPLYNEKHAAQFFGRGKLGGFDKPQKTVFDDRHWSEKTLSEMTERDWRILREDYNISVKGSHIPPPLRSWRESEIPLPILDVIDKIGYKQPTPIQRQAIPIAISNRDLIGIAETGSGKTASFVIPMLCFIKDFPPLDYNNYHLGPYALVLAPTRELALQIEQEAARLASPMGFNCVSIVGGHSLESQSKNLVQGAHIVIATPGRLKDVLERRIMVLSQCTYVVLDEADRMVDLGFETDLKYILDSMPVSNLKPDTDEIEDFEFIRQRLQKRNPYRQTVMFSATMPPLVEKLAKIYLRRPVNVIVGQVGQVVDRIEQRVEFANDESKKLLKMQKILSSNEFDPPIIVFVNQRKTCEAVSKAVEQCGFRSTVLHGGKSQDQREAALAQFKSGNRGVLIATDVAGRGIDVKNVSLVINFDMAKNIQGII